MAKFNRSNMSHGLLLLILIASLFAVVSAPAEARLAMGGGDPRGVRNPQPHFDQNELVEELERPTWKVIMGHRTGGQGGVMHYDACPYTAWMAVDDFGGLESEWSSPSSDEFGQPMWIWAGPARDFFVRYGAVDSGPYRWYRDRTIPQTGRVTVRCVSKWKALTISGAPQEAPASAGPTAPAATPVPGASPTPVFPTPVPSCPRFAGDPTRDLDNPPLGQTCGWSISADDRVNGPGKTGDIPVGFLADYHDPGTGQVHRGVRWDDPRGRNIYADEATFKRLRS